MEHNGTPPIAAVFLVIFDQKVGYTVAWKRALADIELDGVEYKTLPSGLHGVKSDLVYFIQGQHAGVSAFAQGVADARHRNASFVAVGALVPLDHGKLGRSWLHAAELRELAKGLVKNTSDTRALELFWKKHRQDNGNQKGSASSATQHRDSLPAGLKRKRGSFDATTELKLDAEGAIDHPALYMPALLDAFGPLLFPLYRAALLRKRILLLGSPPVQLNCNVVYILSVLSSIPHPVNDLLQPDTEPLFRTQPLFSVGIPDIPVLSSHSSKSGWLATTTDDILGEKPQLWDLLVELAPGVEGAKRRWPRFRTSDGKVVKATQRDLRRYRLLRGALKRMRLARKRYRDDEDNDLDEDEDDDEAPLMRSSTFLKDSADPEEMQSGDNEVVEPVSWTAAAYDSFMWWASAGEQDAWEKEEIHADQELLMDLPAIQDAMVAPSSDDEEENKLFRAQEVATVLTAYFHRLTGSIIQTLADIVQEADDETEEGIEEDAIVVTADEVKKMGLDAWNENDVEFVRQAMRLYFGREAAVAEGGVRMCGMRVC
ncbi:hypothetical protein LTR36_003489 [Oleoguttula mirabilis]|uniref:DUF4484 domain-containing protein n=1 Tax=Oleoguttula mirabilis TaxID=1507867 RepID=A0AAV9JIR7_9PEZI|nr:hypothetical protein LTR36_003489 [Oleoguttula mirabilis]